MAFGKYSRIDGRKPSNCYSTSIILVFVSLCLIGTWMMMSSSVSPAEEPSSERTSNEDGQKLGESHTKKSQDNSPEDAVKVDSSTQDDSSSSVQENDITSEKESENSNERSEEEKLEKENAEVQEKMESEEKETEAKKDESAEKVEEESNSSDKDANSDDGANRNEAANRDEQQESEGTSGDNKQETDDGEKKSENETNADGNKREGEAETETEEATEQKPETRSEESSSESIDEGEKKPVEEDSDGTKEQDQAERKGMVNQDETEVNVDNSNAGPESGVNDQKEILKESATQNGAWSTQSAESLRETEIQSSSLSKDQNVYRWKVCNVTAGPDYIPCLDNIQAINRLTSRSHYQHRERHCPDEAPTCLVPLPDGYKSPLKWPKSRDKIWFSNVPHTKLAEYKGHQNWVKVSGEYLIFPGGGTQFKNGVAHYIDLIQMTVPDIEWGKQTRVILDVGCGVASFGGYLFDRDVLAMSLAPKDEHEAQVQFALERGIPAISAVMGTKRLPYPGRVFDVVHCARCRVPWHVEGGKLLLELNRVLRPGGYFVWSATPVYQQKPEDVGIWKAMTKLTKSMCWDLVKIGEDKLNEVAVAIYRKPTSNDCYENRVKNDPPLCEESDNPNAAWNVSLQACMHRVPEDASERGSQWPETWPSRVKRAPYWLKGSDLGVYGKSAPKDFVTDYEHWKKVVANSYMNGLGIKWSYVRNAMDMRAIYGGFAAALKDMKLWVMNVVPIDSPDTLPIIYERGLFGMYHDWCESFSTYPRSYDLLHADHLFSDIKKRCNSVAVMAEVDRILRPQGNLIVRDNAETISELEAMAKSLHWEIRMTYTEGKEGLLCVQKTMWRPTEVETISSAIA